MIRKSVRLATPLASQALLLAAVGIQLHAQQPATSFLTGSCIAMDSSAIVRMNRVVSNPHVPPSLKGGPTLPTAPSETRRPGYNGEVDVAFIVDEHGRVDRASVTVMTSTDSLLSRWACKETPGIRFEPARDSGHAVSSQVVLPFVYHGPPVKDSASGHFI